MSQKENNNSKEIEVIEIYLESLKEIKPLEEGELDRLFSDFSNGNIEARNRIIEVYLMEAIKVAAEYTNRGVSLADLIQEANVGLMMALSNNGETELSHEHLINNMKEALVTIVEMESKEDEVEERIVRDINRLDDASKELSEGSDHIPTVEELAQYLSLTEEEVRTLMEISLDTL
ncbi:MAG: hypothetical protein GX913_04085 [Clostridiales bacterium]|nr:hypothetical protein [Clostridiales bacterium]